MTPDNVNKADGSQNLSFNTSGEIQQIHQGTLLGRAVYALRTPESSPLAQIALKICAIFLAAILAATIIGVPLIYYAAKEWGIQDEVTKIMAEEKIMSSQPAGQVTIGKPLKNDRSKPAVTYTFTGGRLGDNLISYLHALWISYKYKMPLLYRPFNGAEGFCLSNLSENYRDDVTLRLYGKQKKITTNDLKTVDGTVKDSTMYIMRYFPESPVERSPTYDKFTFDADWDDPEFQKVIAEHLQPIKPVAAAPLKEGYYNVALHVRTGGGFDYDDGDGQYLYPAKLPPMEYYKEIFKIFLKQHKDDTKPIHVHLFTDDKNPPGLLPIFKEVAEECKVPVEFSCKDKSAHNVGVLDDLFAMSQFDCLLRSDSNFSQVSGIIGRCGLEIAPSHYILDKNKNEIVIDKIRIQNRQSKKTEISEQDIYIPKKIVITMKCSMRSPSAFFEWHEKYLSGGMPNWGEDL